MGRVSLKELNEVDVRSSAKLKSLQVWRPWMIAGTLIGFGKLLERISKSQLK
jgi:hypothetical protein